MNFKTLTHKVLLSFFFLSFFSCQQQETIHLRKKVIKRIYPSIVEVIIPKQEDKNITYQRPLPFDQLDYKERNDKYHAIGTAFFISPKRLISAAHVFPADEFSVNDHYYIRTGTGSIHKVKTIYRYSTYRDLIEFDLENYPLNPTFLKLQKQVEIGDMVYAVGNAQGEGISTRGGQVSTFTPEPVAGEWNYIRFSSPASPGNSGGPLVNSKGEVVGVIVMKNNSENLNFALPVSEIANASKEKAHFFSRQLKVQDGMQVTTKDWTYFKPLPSTFLALRESAAPEKDKFYGDLIGQFKKDFEDLIFPNNVRYRDALLYQRLYPRMSMVDKDRALHDWRIEPIVLKKIIVSQENILYHSKGEVFNHYVLFKKSDALSPEQMINNPRDLVNRILIASGAHRYMAGQSIPIVDRGEPDEVIDWKDKLGRPWKTSFWITKYNNTLLASHCSATPEGVYCFFDQNYASQRLEGYMTFVKENIIEVNLSYTGTPQEWQDFQKISDNLKPDLLKEVKISFQKGRLTFQSGKFSWKTPLLKNPQQARMSTLVNYDPSLPMALQIQGFEILFNKNQQNGITIFKAYETQKLAPDEMIERWNQISERSDRYDGAFHILNNQRIKRIPLQSMKTTPYLRGKQNIDIQSQWWMSCYGPVTFPQKNIDAQCKLVRNTIKVE